MLLGAEAVSISTVTSALTSGLSTVADNCMTAIGAVVPYALPIVGAVIVVTIGIRVFRRIAK